MGRLLCVGDLNLDLAITLDHDLAIGSDTAGRIEMYGGGSAANAAAWAARAGAETTFVGAIGDDLAGQVLVRELADVGVDVQAILRSGARTRAVAAIVDADGERSLVSDLDTNDALGLDDHDEQWLDGIDWVHLTAYTHIADRSRDLFRRLTNDAAARAIPFSIDPSAAQLLRNDGPREDALDAFHGARVLFPSHDEAEFLTGSSDPRHSAEMLLDTAECVIVTCGAGGAEVARRDRASFHVDARTTEAVNALGCGDAFAGGFIAAQLAGLDDHRSAVQGIDSATQALRLPSAR